MSNVHVPDAGLGWVFIGTFLFAPLGTISGPCAMDAARRPKLEAWSDEIEPTMRKSGRDPEIEGRAGG